MPHPLTVSGVEKPGTTGAVAVDAHHLYWTSFKNPGLATTIGRANLDGTDVNPRFITGTDNAHGIAISGPYIYWTNFGRLNKVTLTTIGRANLKGTDVNENFIPGADAPCGIAIAP